MFSSVTAVVLLALAAKLRNVRGFVPASGGGGIASPTIATFLQHRSRSVPRRSPFCLTKVAGSLNGNDEDEDDDEVEEGKFLELGREVTETYGPLGIVTAGYREEHLDRIVTACEAALQRRGAPTTSGGGSSTSASSPSALPYLPVVILGKSDLERTFGEVLSGLPERDSVLPADDDELFLAPAGDTSATKTRSYLRYPLLLFSGFEIPQLQLALRYIESMAGEGQLPAPPMFAMAVPKAMEKRVAQLLEEIEGDYHENQVKGNQQPA